MKETGLSTEDVQEIADIRAEIKKHLKLRDKAIAEMNACYARLEGYAHFCNHANGYETSCMGERGFKCPDCGYNY
jgi:tRNA(Ile2) C34 agmatinyltransferase TiaS